MKTTITIEHRFEFDADAQTFEFSYCLRGEDMPGVKEFYVPTGHRIGRPRRQMPAVESLFDDPEKGRRAARRAQKLFDSELHDRVDEALWYLLAEVERRVGILNHDRRAFSRKMSEAIRKGALKRFGRSDRERVLRQTIYDAACQMHVSLSLKNIAEHINRDHRWLQRQVRDHIPEGWSIFKAEIMRELGDGQKVI